MSRLDLPDGGWAILASPRKVSERKRRRYIAAMTDLSAATVDIPVNGDGQPDPRHFTSTHMALSDAVGDTLVLCLVKEWSFGEVTSDVLEELPADAFDVIFKTCRDLAPDLLPDYSPDPDPKVLTSGSSNVPSGSSTAEPTSATP